MVKNNSLNIIINLNTRTEDFIFNEADVSQDVVLSVSKLMDLTTFNFKLNIYNEQNDLLFYSKFPFDGVKLHTTLLDEIHVFPFFFIPDKKYIIKIEYSYLEKNKEAIYNFLGTKPSQPYKSWIWKDSTWQAPVPLPADAGDIISGRVYTWNEEQQSWVPLIDYEVE